MDVSSAIVIGGGIGGLSAAVQLRRLGLGVEVFERQPSLSEVDTGLSLWAFAVRRLDELGLSDGLAQIGEPIERLVHRSATGRELSEVPVPSLAGFPGIHSYEVHRSKLQQLLAGALGDELIHFRHRCISVRPTGGGVEALFEDGRKASADVLVGADGIRSKVRDDVAGPRRLRNSPIGVWRGTTSLREDEHAGGLHLRFMGPGAIFGIARISDELVRWYAGARYVLAPRSGSEARALALEEFAGWPPLVVGTLERTAPERYLWNDTPHAPPLRTWGRGGITLLGDAAHQAVPTLGISAGLAIEDAAVLAESLSTAPDEISGLRAYEARRRPIAARVVRAAALFGGVQMIRRQPAYALRQLGVRIAPQRRGIDWIVRGGERGSRSANERSTIADDCEQVRRL